MATDEVTQNALPSFNWTLQGTGALVSAAAPCAHLPPWGVQTNLEFVRIKVRKIHESIALKKKDKTPPGWFRFSQVTENFMGMKRPAVFDWYLEASKTENDRELAACENMLDAVKLTSKDLLRDGFGDNPLFYCLIAEVQNHQKPSGKVTVGFAMYYFTYDPWIGKLLYLEDFYVIQAYRGLGIGAEMLKRLSQIAIRRQCNCMHFLVVIWNQASIDYYTRRGALDLSSEEGWHLFRFNREELMDMAGEE
nr:PREDICTED: spermidine/spermine N(1)-acetyltransferase-like protein 1 [Bos mutus]